MRVALPLHFYESTLLETFFDSCVYLEHHHHRTCFHLGRLSILSENLRIISYNPLHAPHTVHVMPVNASLESFGGWRWQVSVQLYGIAIQGRGEVRRFSSAGRPTYKCSSRFL